MFKNDSFPVPDLPPKCFLSRVFAFPFFSNTRFQTGSKVTENSGLFKIKRIK